MIPGWGEKRGRAEERPGVLPGAGVRSCWRETSRALKGQGLGLTGLRPRLVLEPRPAKGPVARSVASVGGLMSGRPGTRMLGSDSGDVVRWGPGHSQLLLLPWETPLSPSVPVVSSKENALVFH